MIEADNAEFLELLGDLFGAHSRNVKADIAGGYQKGLKHMTLGEFRAVVEYDLEQLQHAAGGVARPPTVAEIWEVHRTLKRKVDSSSASSPATPSYNGDDWSITGNLLLLKHVTRDTIPPDLDYAPDSHGRPVFAGPHTEAIAKILTRWMNSWVTNMRASRRDSYELEGRAEWVECMAQADREVREYSARYIVRQAAA